ncbi:FRG domain-containing protein [Acinetobacter sp. AS167]|uniref:FRG domain-containing protein n=1 Tax=Acinetobacter sp. AS167 TaxID=3127884 RepID=UPI0030174FA0
MLNYKQRHFDTAQEIWDAIRPEEINNQIGDDLNPIFRGQGNADWKLSPNASRTAVDITIRDQVKFEVQMLVHFLEYCDKTGIQVPGHIASTKKSLDEMLSGANDKDLFEWPTDKYHEILAFAQHYGVSTRLLDWSKRSFIAAYFSSSEAVKGIADAIVKNTKPDLKQRLAIWILESKKVYNHNTQFNYSSNRSLIPFDIISIPSNVNFHIAAQQGCFTIFRHVSKEINDNDDEWFCKPLEFSKDKTLDTTNLNYSKYLHKWTLPYSEAHKLLKLCELYNVNAASVYPTATGVGYAVKDLMNIQVIEKYLSSIT